MFGDWVAIVPDPPKAFGDGGIIIPEHLRTYEELHLGTVTGVGPGFAGAPIENLEYGDRVLYTHSQAKRVGEGDNQYFIIHHASLVERFPANDD